jgi:hypothetical protein
MGGSRGETNASVWKQRIDWPFANVSRDLPFAFCLCRVAKIADKGSTVNNSKSSSAMARRFAYDLA